MRLPRLQLVLLIIIPLIFFSCTKNTVPPTNPPDNGKDSVVTVKPVDTLLLAGYWRGIENNFWYALTLYPSHVYVMDEHPVNTSFTSTGTWKIKGDSIMFTGTLGGATSKIKTLDKDNLVLVMADDNYLTKLFKSPLLPSRRDTPPGSDYAITTVFGDPLKVQETITEGAFTNVCCRINPPNDVDIDNEGNVYCLLEGSNAKLIRIGTDKKITILIDFYKDPFGTVTLHKMCLDKTNNCIYAFNDNEFYKFSIVDRKLTEVKGTYPGDKSEGTLYGIRSIAVDKKGNQYLFIVDYLHKAGLWKRDGLTGKLTEITVKGTVTGPNSPPLPTSRNLVIGDGIYVSNMAVDPTQKFIYFIDGAYNNIWKIEINAGLLEAVAGNGDQIESSSLPYYNGLNTETTKNAILKFPFGLTVDDHGDVFFSDVQNCRVRKIETKTGIITTLAGTRIPGDNGDDLNAGHVQLNDPYDIAVNTKGEIVFIDYNNKKIRKLTKR
jgi:DNA-binding beta-propeller fold protein YncE